MTVRERALGCFARSSMVWTVNKTTPIAMASALKRPFLESLKRRGFADELLFRGKLHRVPEPDDLHGSVPRRIRIGLRGRCTQRLHPSLQCFSHWVYNHLFHTKSQHILCLQRRHGRLGRHHGGARVRRGCAPLRAHSTTDGTASCCPPTSPHGVPCARRSPVQSPPLAFFGNKADQNIPALANVTPSSITNEDVFSL